MANGIMKLKISEHAQAAYDALEPSDRRYADALFDRFRNWHDDPTIRTESIPLAANDDVIEFRIHSDLIANFELAGNTIRVLSVEHNENREDSGAAQ